MKIFDAATPNSPQRFRAAGWEAAAGPETADLLLFNTCSVRQGAEDRLRGLPSWLAFLERIDPVRVMAAFSVMYWYYAQMDEIAREGEPWPGMSVLGATRRILSRHRRLLKKR